MRLVSLRSGFSLRSYELLPYLASILLLLSAHPLINPDAGWHLRTGEQIWLRGEIPRVDWFSYSAPDYPWVCHSWLQDLALFAFWATGNLLGLPLWGVRLFHALLGLVLINLILRAFLHSKNTNVSNDSRAWLFLALSVLVVALKLLRPQIATAYGFVILLWGYDRLTRTGDAETETCKKPILIYLPLLMAVWANLHAGFIIAYIVIGALLFGAAIDLYWRRSESFCSFGRSFEQWRIVAFAALLSVPATLLNPYGWGVYTEAIHTLKDSESKKLISEWRPFDLSLSNSQLVIIMGAILAWYLWSRRDTIGRAIEGAEIAILGLTSILAINSSRHSSFFVIAAVWIIFRRISLREIRDLNEYCAHSHFRFKWAHLLFIAIISLFLWIDDFKESMPFPVAITTSVGKYYPVELFQFPDLLNRPLKVFTQLGWGGFVLYANPEAKVYVDGRMAHWHKGDSSYFRTIHNFLAHPDPDLKLLKQTEPDVVILDKNSPLMGILKQNIEAWELLQLREDIAIFRRKEEDVHWQ